MFQPKQAKQQDENLKKQRKEEEKAKQKDKNRSIELTEVTLEEEKSYRRGTISIKDLISPSSMEIKPNFLMLGDLHVRTFFVISYPRYISVGWFAPIINLNSTFDVSMFFYPVNYLFIFTKFFGAV